MAKKSKSKQVIRVMAEQTEAATALLNKVNEMFTTVIPELYKLAKLLSDKLEQIETNQTKDVGEQNGNSEIDP